MPPTRPPQPEAQADQQLAQEGVAADRIRFVGNTAVASLQRHGADWRLHDTDGQTVAQASDAAGHNRYIRVFVHVFRVVHGMREEGIPGLNQSFPDQVVQMYYARIGIPLRDE